MEKRGQMQPSGFWISNPDRAQELEDKRGVLDMSFGMIFSIFIIIATIAVAGYVITQFFSTSECARIQLFYDSLQKRTNEVWRSTQASTVFNGDLPSKVESVCFGDVEKLDRRKYKNEAEELSILASAQKNIYMYPKTKCGSNVDSHSLENVEISQPFCINAVKGNVKVVLVKESGRQRVSVTE